MPWWQRERHIDADAKKPLPEGLWHKCDECDSAILTEEFVANLRVCPNCGLHGTMPTPERLAATVDDGSFVEEDADLAPEDALGFNDSKKYGDRLRSSQKKTGSPEAFLAGSARIDGRPAQVGFFVFEFMGGSMGSVVGEKVARVVRRARERREAAVVFSASGGARMQEGILSLMQMAKTSAELAALRAARVPYISVLLNPTTGGVAASFAMLGDVILAEPKALIGFAGPRVIEQTIRAKLPEGFQRSEFLLEHGMIDQIVPRHALKSRIAEVISLLM